jgi:phosphoribosylglycinamide formyltransferase-1
MKRRVAILISGRGSNMAALVEAAAKTSDYPAEIAVVISNRADADGLDKARASGIATVVIESKPFGKDRAGFETALEAALASHKVELICLAGFMRLFTPNSCSAGTAGCSTSIPRCCPHSRVSIRTARRSRPA